MTAPRWERVLVHHSASQDHDARDLDAIRRHHVQVNGWADIGYHVVVERVLGRYVALDGRPLWRPGAHCPGRNRDSIGVCFVGDFSLTSPTAEQLDAGAARIGDLCRIYGIPLERIEPHRAHRATECPGLRFPMADLVERVRRYLDQEEG